MLRAEEADHELSGIAIQVLAFNHRSIRADH